MDGCISDLNERTDKCASVRIKVCICVSGVYITAGGLVYDKRYNRPAWHVNAVGSKNSKLPCVLQLQVRKSELEKRKNDDEQEEGWVACDACGAWVHMICGLFNKGRNDDDMNYHCPKCLITGIPHSPPTTLLHFSAAATLLLSPVSHASWLHHLRHMGDAQQDRLASGHDPPTLD